MGEKFSSNKHRPGSIFDLLKQQRKEMYYAILHKRPKSNPNSAAKTVAEMMADFEQNEPETPDNVIPFVVRNIKYKPKGK